MPTVSAIVIDGQGVITNPNDGPPDPKRLEAVELVASYLDETSVTRRVSLDQYDFEELRSRGLTRTEVERAVEDLARAGRIDVIAARGAVVLELPIGRRP